jgi:hypothetical protein
MYGAIDPRFADLRVQLRRDLLRKVAVEVVKTLENTSRGAAVWININQVEL